MKGAILSEGEEFFTYMSYVFNAIRGIQKEYNWLITNLEAYPKTPKFIEYVNSDYVWLSGNELTEMVEIEDFQWIWAVLSGFPTSVTKEQVLQYDLPNADEHEGFYQNPITIQHPLAVVEIAPIDSSFVIIISRDDKIVNDFLTSAPLAIDLEVYNNSRK